MVWITVSCSQPEVIVQVPKDVLPKEKMAAVLCDLSVMEAGINVSRFNAANATDSLRFNIYRQHNISRRDYDSSIAFYSRHPEEFKKVYELVIEKLSRLQ
ncbi:MAG: DUF4296 domain-containing protein [Bacteroidia bacterium]